MQLSTRNGYGTVSIDTGTSRVVGNAQSDWTQVVPGSSWFTLVGDTATVYTVQDKTEPGSTLSGFWEVTLDGVFALPSIVGADYAIHKNFTPRRHLPLFDPGDVQRSQIWNRAMWILDQADSMIPPLDSTAVPTLLKPKPSLWPVKAQMEGIDVLQWWLLESGDPTGFTATIDDPTTRWHQLG